ncbi:MAG: glycoside hydrolase, partial [Anaerococcus sp.]|nr:glycoside hydrolase [Anaerococcus sp.]
MKKKNIGAMITVIAAVTAGASAYATTLDNLDQDQNTNSLINEANYTDTYSDYDLVKYEYSKEVENTKIAKTSKTIEEEKQAEEAILDKKIEDAAREVIIEASKLEDKVSEEESEDNIEQVEVAKDDLSQEPVEEKAPIKQVEEPIENTQETEEEEKEEVLPVVKYVNTPLLNVRSSKDLEENNIIASLEAGDKIVGYQEDGFLVTEDGYVSEDFLSEAYPEDLLEDLSAAEEEAKAEEEARAAEEAKRAEEEA